MIYLTIVWAGAMSPLALWGMGLRNTDTLSTATMSDTKPFTSNPEVLGLPSAPINQADLNSFQAGQNIRPFTTFDSL